MSDHFPPEFPSHEPLMVDPAVAARAKLHAGRVGDSVKVDPEAVKTAWEARAAAFEERAATELTGVAATLAERGKRYGDFTDHATICQDIKRAMRGLDGCATNWEGLTNAQRQALEVIADKIARILSGDPEYKDNWHDIQGYAKLAEDRCKE